MDRAIPFVVSTVAIVSGLALAAIVLLAWQPCAGVGLPATGESAPACAAIGDAGPTGWIGGLWPFALIVALYAAFRAVATHWTAGTIAAVPVLVLLTIAANPAVESTLLGLRATSTGEPPWTGSLTALVLLLAGLLLSSTVPRHVAARRPGAARVQLVQA
ncbi:hypothetical protein [Agrococcus sp. Marseille-Q4369]|uniref:hypothetical protein n=1 Tax=Agrococcus sp. Marseille-Q4369 TaxID=2810513 RepID=UPI001B8D97B6|nr:hypothetical protein [Agrococcus sp. Marseille-Q4369]QUW19821.1 hypothetical protein JSQ78_05945 [Agrococcus sp. Marseille-Q4369]